MTASKISLIRVIECMSIILIITGIIWGILQELTIRTDTQKIDAKQAILSEKVIQQDNGINDNKHAIALINETYVTVQKSQFSNSIIKNDFREQDVVNQRIYGYIISLSAKRCDRRSTNITGI